MSDTPRTDCIFELHGIGGVGMKTTITEARNEMLAIERELTTMKIERNELCMMFRQIGREIPYVGDGNFENDPPNAITDALLRITKERRRNMK